MTLADQLISVLDTHPQGWNRSTKYFLEYEDGTKIYLGSYTNPYITLVRPQERSFSWWERFRIKRAVRRWEKSPIDMPSKTTSSP